MMFLMLTLAAAGAGAIAAQPDAASGQAPLANRPHSHIHAAGEIDEEQGPILFQITYTGEVMGNVAGGRRKGARYLDNLDIIFESDLDRLMGWTGAQLHLYGLYNNGRSISDLVGDAQAVSNIETGVRAFRLYEAWINQKIGVASSIKIGLYDLNSEFDALDSAGLFMGSAHGIGTDFSQSGQNGPSIFPSTSLAARIDTQPAEGWTIRAAILDGVPGDPDHPGRTAIHLGGGDGALLVGEVEAHLGKAKLLAGHWQYTARFDPNDGGPSSRGNAGSYIRAEMPLVERGDRRIDGFARWGVARGRFNMFDEFASAGLRFQGWVPGREDDEFGIAVATAFPSRSYRALGTRQAETAFEATYRSALTPFLSIQPNIQYVRNPAFYQDRPDALVVGLRFELSHDFD